MKRIVLTGGGTAGHVTPNIALLPRLHELGYDVQYIGSYDGIEKKLIEELGVPYHGIASGKLRRYFDWKNFSDPFRVMKGFFQSKKLLKQLKPDIIFSKGGFVSVPVVQAAKQLHIPVIIHESDMTPGLANKLALPAATKVCCNFPETVPYLPAGKAVVTGSPIRAELHSGNKLAALKFCGFTAEKPVLLIIGGSLGYPVAFFISRSSEKLQNILVLAITIPMWINMLVRTYAWIGLLSEGGLIQRLLGFFGITRGELLYTEGAVLLGMVYNFLPFMVLQINTSLCKMDHSLLEASADLGANARQTFIRVTLPMSLPGVINGITLVFLPAVSSFFIPKLLGGGQYFLIGNLIENQFITVGEWNFGSAISMIMAAVMMLLMMLVRKAEIHNRGGKEE